MKIKYSICEDVRREVENKITLAGLFPSDIIYIEKPVDENTPRIISKLMILINLSEHEGSVNLKGQLTLPGQDFSEIFDLGPANIPSRIGHNFIFDMSGMPIIKEGTCTFHFFVDDKDYPLEFNVYFHPE